MLTDELRMINVFSFLSVCFDKIKRKNNRTLKIVKQARADSLLHDYIRLH